MFGHLRNERAAGKVAPLFLVLIVLAAGYAAIQLAIPYNAYKDLQRTMQYWANFSLQRGDTDYSDLISKVMDTVENHQIPLEKDDIEIFYDNREKSLSVRAEYNVYVEFPGYQHQLRFSPEAMAQVEDP